MRNRLIAPAPWLLLTLIFCCRAIANQAEIDQLLSEEKLLVNAWVAPQQVVAKQKVQVFIELATESRFSAGTRIQRFEIPNALVLQREKFAVNSTRRINGTTFTVQLWSLDVFPMGAGDYQIPPLGLEVSVAKSVYESSQGVVNTQPIPFTALIPELLEGIDDFVSAPRLDVTESFDRSLEELEAGDAIVRTIRMSADDIPAMMLPELIKPEIENVGVYSNPAQINDVNDRGAFIGERTEVFTYVFERPGEFIIPPLEFHWWNTDSQSLETVSLPEYILSVGGEIPADEVEPTAAEKEHEFNWQRIQRLVTWAVIIFIAVWVIRGLRRLWRKLAEYRRQQALKPPAESKLKRQFAAACRKGDQFAALNLFYQWAGLYAGNRFNGAVRPTLSRINAEQVNATFNQWMTTMFARQPQDDKKLMEQFAQQVEALVAQQKPKPPFEIPPVELKLN